MVLCANLAIIPQYKWALNAWTYLHSVWKHRVITSSQKCNKWLPERASTFASVVSLQCAPNTYQSIKAVIVQGTKWDRVIARGGRGRWNPASR